MNARGKKKKDPKSHAMAGQKPEKHGTGTDRKTHSTDCRGVARTDGNCDRQTNMQGARPQRECALWLIFFFFSDPFPSLLPSVFVVQREMLILVSSSPEWPTSDAPKDTKIPIAKGKGVCHLQSYAGTAAPSPPYKVQYS